MAAIPSGMADPVASCSAIPAKAISDRLALHDTSEHAFHRLGYEVPRDERSHIALFHVAGHRLPATSAVVLLRMVKGVGVASLMAISL